MKSNARVKGCITGILIQIVETGGRTNAENYKFIS